MTKPKLCIVKNLKKPLYIRAYSIPKPSISTDLMYTVKRQLEPNSKDEIRSFVISKESLSGYYFTKSEENLPIIPEELTEYCLSGITISAEIRNLMAIATESPKKGKIFDKQATYLVNKIEIKRNDLSEFLSIYSLDGFQLIISFRMKKGKLINLISIRFVLPSFEEIEESVEKMKNNLKTSASLRGQISKHSAKHLNGDPLAYIFGYGKKETKSSDLISVVESCIETITPSQRVEAIAWEGFREVEIEDAVNKESNDNLISHKGNNYINEDNQLSKWIFEKGWKFVESHTLGHSQNRLVTYKREKQFLRVCYLYNEPVSAELSDMPEGLHNAIGLVVYADHVSIPKTYPKWDKIKLSQLSL